MGMKNGTDYMSNPDEKNKQAISHQHYMNPKKLIGIFQEFS